MTDRDLIDEIKANSKPIFEHFLNVDLRYRETAVHCPFHGGDNRPSMGVNFQKGMFNCLACGAAGDVITFVKRVEDCTFPLALKLCCEIAGIDDGHSRSFDPEVKRRAQERQEEAELLAALRAWHGRTAMHWAADAHSLERELMAQENKLSLVTEEQKAGKKALFCVMESYAESLRCQLKVSHSKHEAFMSASDDLYRMAVLFVQEYDLKYRPTTIREMDEAIGAIWFGSMGDEIDVKHQARLEQLLALAILRQLHNKDLLEHLGRGWYVDVLIPHDPGHSYGDSHGNLFDDAGEDRPAQDSGGALEGPRLGDRALAEAAREAVERAERVRSEVKSAGEAIAAHMRERMGIPNG